MNLQQALDELATWDRQALIDRALELRPDGYSRERYIQPKECPVAVILTGMVGGVIRVGGISVHRHSEDGSVVHPILPDNVIEFVSNFDTGKIPELEI